MSEIVPEADAELGAGLGQAEEGVVLAGRSDLAAAATAAGAVAILGQRLTSLLSGIGVLPDVLAFDEAAYQQQLAHVDGSRGRIDDLKRAFKLAQKSA